jgi:hypothetical protein
VADSYKLTVRQLVWVSADLYIVCNKNTRVESRTLGTLGVRDVHVTGTCNREVLCSECFGSLFVSMTVVTYYYARN